MPGGQLVSEGEFLQGFPLLSRSRPQTFARRTLTGEALCGIPCWEALVTKALVAKEALVAGRPSLPGGTAFPVKGVLVRGLP